MNEYEVKVVEEKIVYMEAETEDEGLGISPPCCEFFAYMKCPTCKTEVIDEAHKIRL